MKSQNLSEFTLLSVMILTMASQGEFDYKYFITLALQNKIAWSALPFIIEGLTPTLEKSKDVNNFLLQELEKSHAKIQNLEGGIIKKIYVKEGVKVKQGDVLLDLEMIISESEVGEINSRLAFLDTEILFLKKILNGDTSIENIKKNKNYPEIFEASKIQYNSLQSKIKTKLKIEQKKLDNFRKTKKLLQNKPKDKIMSSNVPFKTKDRKSVV